jgi:hypothetical protein
MRKVCPQCNGTFETQFLCPVCGVEMMDVPDRSAVISVAAADESLRAARVGQQLLAGLLLAQGVYYAVRQAAAGLALLGVLPETNNLLVQTGLQAVAALAGGLVAGVGNPRGAVAGTAVGVINALLFAITPFALTGRPPSVMALYLCLPGIAVAAAGALIGRWLWPSVHDLPDPTGQPKGKQARAKLAAPPVTISWLRVLAGAALAVGCTVWAGRIRDSVLVLGGGAFSLESHIQSQFIAWAITLLAMMIGGAFAGAGSRGGIRHGFLVGLLACIGIFVVHQEVVKEILPAEEFFAELLHLPENGTPSALQITLFLLTNTLLIGVAAGWFGSKLLPKLGERRRNSVLDSGAI